MLDPAAQTTSSNHANLFAIFSARWCATHRVVCVAVQFRLVLRSILGPLIALAWLFTGLSAGLPSPVAAHTKSVSHSSWRFNDDGARVRLRIPRLELTRVGLDAPPEDPVLSEQAGRYLAERLVLRAGDSRCELTGEIERRRADEGWASFAWEYRCPSGAVRSGGPSSPAPNAPAASSPAPSSIETAILLEVAPSHLHFARLALESGRITERVLTEESPSWQLPRAGDGRAAEAAVGSSIASYVALGVEHILTGWDHLAFVLALLILAGTLGEMARVITGFTIAHSVTLALAVLGFVQPQAAAVEAVIGFSVALVAAENAWALGGRGRVIPLATAGGLVVCGALALLGWGRVPAATLLGLAVFTACHFALLERSDRPARIRAALAFAFGLVHGFGFAGILGEMQLPTERLAPALFGFNVGVELGQLAVVALAWPLLRWLEGLAGGRWHRFAVDAGSAVICGTGLFWFVTRTFGAS